MKIILASTSPRRKYFLDKMGVEYEAIAGDYEEVHDEDSSVYDVVEKLAKGKADAVADLHPDALVIGGDTIVAIDGKQLGKPKTRKEAFETLKSYSGRSQEVASGLAVICRSKNIEKICHAVTTVAFKDLSDEIINEYLDKNTYQDKGGSYALQDPTVQRMIESIDGGIDNVVGMPTNLLSDIFDKLGIESTRISEGDLTSSALFD